MCECVCEYVCARVYVFVCSCRTLCSGQVSVGGGSQTQLLGSAEAPAVQEHRQVDDVPHVVVAVDVGVTQHAVQVLVDGLDDDVGVAGKDGDEGPLVEQHPHLVAEGNSRLVWYRGELGQNASKSRKLE